MHSLSLGEAASPDSIGRYLSRQRKLREITLEELAEITRIPVRSLQRLEAGAFDGHSDGFARSFVRTVAVAIGLDAEETVSRMLQETVVEHGVSLSNLGRSVVVLAGVVALIFLVLGAFELWQFSRGLQHPAGPLPLRRDAVRELALEHGVLESGRELETAFPTVLLPQADPSSLSDEDHQASSP